jgi:hypothetical protein
MAPSRNVGTSGLPIRAQRLSDGEGDVNSGENTRKTMNSAGTEHFIRVELKYCERCGELWTRRSGEVESRCQRCVAVEGQLPQLWRERSRPENRANVPPPALMPQAIESMEAAEL